MSIYTRTRRAKSTRPHRASSIGLTSFSGPGTEHQDEIRPNPYPVRVPDSEYLAVCIHVFGPHTSRVYGEKFYLTFQIIDGEHAGKKLPMFLSPSKFPTSNLYRFWSIANDGPPSRNARLSPRIFLGKAFRVRTATVKPRHRVTGADGKIRAGDYMPEFMWYSRIDCVLSLEATNEPLNGATKISRNSFPGNEMGTGRVGSRKPEAGNELCPDSFRVFGGGSSAGFTNQAGGKCKLTAGPTPVTPISIAHAPASPADPKPGTDLWNKKYFESALYRKRLFETYDNLPPFFSHKERVEKVVEKAVRELFMNRDRELKEVDENAVLETARSRLNRFANFEGIKHSEKRRKVVVGCVVNAVAEGALAAVQRDKT